MVTQARGVFEKKEQYKRVSKIVTADLQDYLSMQKSEDNQKIKKLAKLVLDHKERIKDLELQINASNANRQHDLLKVEKSQRRALRTILKCEVATKAFSKHYGPELGYFQP